jgi:hypothetical protein
MLAEDHYKSKPMEECNAAELLALYAGDYELYADVELDRTLGPLPRTLTDEFTAPSNSSLGALGELPLEILQCILTPLDFRSFLEFSKTSWRAHEIVVGTCEYRAFRSPFSSFFRAIDSYGLSQWHSVKTLYITFRSISCASCGGWAPLVHTPSCQRRCYLCFQKPAPFFSLEMSLFEAFPRITGWLRVEGILRARPRISDCNSLCLSRDQLRALAMVIDRDDDVINLATIFTQNPNEIHPGVPRVAKYYSRLRTMHWRFYESDGDVILL